MPPFQRRKAGARFLIQASNKLGRQYPKKGSSGLNSAGNTRDQTHPDAWTDPARGKSTLHPDPSQQTTSSPLTAALS
jgi:hypothetical protein